MRDDPMTTMSVFNQVFAHAGRDTSEREPRRADVQGTGQRDRPRQERGREPAALPAGAGLGRRGVRRR